MFDYDDNIKNLFDTVDDKTVVNIIFSHFPRKEGNLERYEELECCFRNCAKRVFDLLPNRIERVRVLFKLQEAMFWSMALLDREHSINNYLQGKKMKRELADFVKTQSKPPGPEEEPPEIQAPGPPRLKERTTQELGGVETETGKVIKEVKESNAKK